jgi:hypothetical protein
MWNGKMRYENWGFCGNESSGLLKAVYSSEIVLLELCYVSWTEVFCHQNPVMVVSSLFLEESKGNG